MRAPLVVRDRELPFPEYVTIDETCAVDSNLGIMAKVSSLIDVLLLVGSYEMEHKLWPQFTLSAVPVNMDVTWSRDMVLVKISNCSVTFTYRVCIQFVAYLVHHSQWDVPLDFVSHQLGSITRELQRGFGRIRQRGADLSSNLR